MSTHKPSEERIDLRCGQNHQTNHYQSIFILAYEEAEPVLLAQIEKYSLFNESIIVGTFAIIGNIIVVVICTEGAPRSRLFDDRCYIHLRWSCLQTHHHHHHIFKHLHRSFFHGPSSGNFPLGIHLSCCIWRHSPCILFCCCRKYHNILFLSLIS